MEAMLIHWLEVGGLAALAAVMATERFLPILPSYAVLALGGLAAAEGAYGIEGAVAASLLGSFVGCLGWYGLGYAIGPERVGQFIARRGRWLGLTPRIYDRASAAYKRNSRLLLAVSQLVPTVRIFATFPAGVLRVPVRGVLLPTAVGILGWNAAFVGAGYLLGESPLAGKGLALPTLLTVVVVEAVVVWSGYLLWQGWRRRRRRARGPAAAIPQK